jgi:hypothetical protein
MGDVASPNPSLAGLSDLANFNGLMIKKVIEHIFVRASDWISSSVSRMNRGHSLFSPSSIN